MLADAGRRARRACANLSAVHDHHELPASGRARTSRGVRTIFTRVRHDARVTWALSGRRPRLRMGSATRGRRLSNRSAVVQFGLSGLAATLVIGAMVVAVSRHVGTDQAIRNAKQVTRLAGMGFVE